MDEQKRLWDDALAARVTRRQALQRGLALGLSIPALSVLLAACSSQAPQASGAPGASDTPASGGLPSAGAAKTLQFMAWDAQPEQIRKNLKAWTSISGVPTELTIAPNIGYATALQTRLQGGAEVDVYYQFTYLEGKYIEAQWARNLIDMPDAAAMLDDMFPSLRSRYASPDGKTVYGVPYWNGAYVTLYNTKNLSKAGITEPPKTLSDLHAQCQKLKDSGVSPNPYTGYWVKQFMEEYLMAYLIAEGVKPFDDAGNPVFADDPKSVGVLEWWQSMYQDKLVPATILTDTPDASVAKLGSGDATFYCMHDYFMRYLHETKNAPETPNVEILYRMPGASGNTFMAGDIIQMGTQMSEASVKDAWDLMKFYGWKDREGKYTTFKAWGALMSAGTPYPALFKDPEYRASMGPGYNMDELARVYETSDPVGPRSAPWYATFQIKVGDRLHAMLLGQATPAATVAALASDAKSGL